MEKLIVKNFGPIKEIEIELSQYTVFIGDTSSGKSTLAKLIAIFRDFDFIVDSSFLTFLGKLKEYGILFQNKSSSIIYLNKEYSWEVLFEDKHIHTNFKFKEIFKNYLTKGYNSIFTTDKVADNYDSIYLSFREFIASEKFKDLDEVSRSKIELLVNELENAEKYPRGVSLLSQILLLLYKYVDKKIEFQSSLYFPTERNIVSVISDSIGGLYANNVALPESFKKFFSLFEVSRKEVGKYFNIKDFDISFSHKDGNNIISAKDYEISLDVASSGIQSIVPLYVIIENVFQEKNPFRNTLIIEEPELNLFPEKQKVLTEYLVSKINESENKLVITTHSPYLLTVFDNLLLAKNVVDNKPQLEEATNSIIPRGLWIDYHNISMYQVENNGTIKSIKNEEYKSVDANVIDVVSDIVSNDFDKLSDLLYVED